MFHRILQKKMLHIVTQSKPNSKYLVFNKLLHDQDQDPTAYDCQLGQNLMEEINLTNKSLGHILGPQKIMT